MERKMWREGGREEGKVKMKEMGKVRERKRKTRGREDREKKGNSGEREGKEEENK